VADYEWDSLVFDGDPLKTIMTDIVTATADVSDALAAILRAQAALLDLIAPFLSEIDNPYVLIAELIIELLSALLGVLTGNVHMLFVSPTTQTDEFGIQGFVERVIASMDDAYDTLKPDFDDYNASTIDGGEVTDAGSGAVDVTAWQGLLSSAYYSAAAGTVDLSAQDDGRYLITAELSGTLTFVDTTLINVPDDTDPTGMVTLYSLSTWEDLPTVEDVTTYMNSFIDMLANLEQQAWSGIPLAIVRVAGGVIGQIQDVRAMVPVFTMTVLYVNDSSMLSLYNKIAGLSVFFPQQIAVMEDKFNHWADYVPREQLTTAQATVAAAQQNYFGGTTRTSLTLEVPAFINEAFAILQDTSSIDVGDTISFSDSVNSEQVTVSSIDGRSVGFESALTRSYGTSSTVTAIAATSAAFTGIRPKQQPPDWITPSPATVFRTIISPLREMMAAFTPEPSTSDFIGLLSTAMLSYAIDLETIADRLESLAEILDDSGYTAARLFIPLTYGGNQMIKNILLTTQNQLVDEGYVETTFSFGLVMIAGSGDQGMMRMIAGLDPYATQEAGVISIENGSITVVDTS
jgi:hypothetical protein